MSGRHRIVMAVVIAVTSLPLAGCVIIVNDGWGIGGPTVWTGEKTEKLVVSTPEPKSMSISTHNGWVHVTGQESAGPEAVITVTKKTGGLTASDAAKAMEALEVFAESEADGKYRVGYRWKGIKHSNWGARVNFDVQVPAGLAVDVETHNGDVEITGIRGDVTLDTHNGDVNVTSHTGRLHAETHNGRIAASYNGPDLSLVSHNGRITSDLGQCGPVRGRIITHNGAVEISVGEKTSADLTCQTHNGSITFEAPVATRKVSRRQFVGTLGSGGQPLDVTTHNGSIHVKKAAG